MLFLLIDTRDPAPEPEPGRRRSALAAAAAGLGWMYPWPAIVGWLFVATLVLEDLPGAIAAYALLIVAFWRMMRAMPADGLGTHQQ